jgi:hypothetical protein
MTPTALIFTKLVLARWHHMEIFYTEFHSSQTRTMKIRAAIHLCPKHDCLFLKNYITSLKWNGFIADTTRSNKNGWKNRHCLQIRHSFSTSLKMPTNKIRTQVHTTIYLQKLFLCAYTSWITKTVWCLEYLKVLMTRFLKFIYKWEVDDYDQRQAL